MFLAALVASQALACVHQPHPIDQPCPCERPVEQRYEEVRLNDGFFYGGGGVGMNYSAPVYGGGGFVVVSGGGSSFAGAGAGPGAPAGAALTGVDRR